MKLTVVIVTCRRCGRVLHCSTPRVTDLGNPDPGDDEIEVAGDPCSPAFARWVACPEHPAPPPDQHGGLVYSSAACPLLWSTRIVDVPDEVAAAGRIRDRLRKLVDSWGNGRVHAGVDRMIPSSEIRTLLEEKT